MSTLHIGWVGLGKMGLPMAKHIKDAGYELTVYNRTAAKEEELKQQGVATARTPAALIQQADVVFIMVSDDNAVREIFMGNEGLLKEKPANKIIVNCSTVSPAISKEMAALCKATGSDYIDAPVSGSVKQAQEAALVIMVGGEKDVFEKVKPVLEKIGKMVLYIGKHGEGNAAKLAVNTFLAIVTMGLAEAITFANEQGVRTEDFLTVINNGALASPYIKIKGDAIQSDNFKAAFSLSHMAKDLKLAKEAGLTSPLGLNAYDIFQQAIDAYGEEDVMAVIKQVRK